MNLLESSDNSSTGKTYGELKAVIERKVYSFLTNQSNFEGLHKYDKNKVNIYKHNAQSEALGMNAGVPIYKRDIRTIYCNIDLTDKKGEEFDEASTRGKLLIAVFEKAKKQFSANNQIPGIYVREFKYKDNKYFLTEQFATEKGGPNKRTPLMDFQIHINHIFWNGYHLRMEFVFLDEEFKTSEMNRFWSGLPARESFK